MSRRGFTLIEVVTVLVVTTILAALSLSAYGRLKARASFSAFTTDLVARLNQARERSALDQRPVVAVFLATVNAGTRYVVFEDVDANFTLATFDPTAAIAAPDVLLYDETSASTVSVGPSTGWGGLLPPPFSAVPAGNAASFGSPTTFAAPYTRRAFVRFQADGTLAFGTGALTGSFSVQDSASPGRSATIAMIGPSATIRGFYK